MEKSSVTPWDVVGEVDYDKVVREFGVQKIDEALLKRFEKHAKSNHFMLDRGIYFAHRDLVWILDQLDKGNKFFLYTGRGPSGKMHIGHLMPFIFAKWIQDAFGVELWIQFTDDEKFLFKQDMTLEEVQKHMQDNMIDIVALGFNPKKTHFLVDTMHAGIMYPQAIKVAKKITYSMIRSSFGLDESSNIGEIFYTSMQAVPAFLPSVLQNKKMPCLIPHAIDQDPHFRLTRDILPKLGYPKPASIQSSFLPPLQGANGKMSSSNNESAIFLTDSPKEVEHKIKKYAFSGGRDTLEEHRRHGGNPDVDIAYQYLKFLFEPDDTKLQIIHRKYKSGEMTSGELKQIAIDKINEFLKEHQKKRKVAEKSVEKFIYRI
ncbi:MAG: tryptophan--tRNA ligase [Candidatus Pacearchaeota archaeon]